MDQVAFIHRTSFDERLPWLTGIHSPEEDVAYFSDHVFTKCEVWGALHGTLVGFIAFHPGWIEQLYVLPQWQRRGAGRLLLQVAMTASHDLRLSTFQKNEPSRLFYEAHGFVAIQKTDGAANEEREPDVLYQWKHPAQPEKSN